MRATLEPSRSPMMPNPKLDLMPGVDRPLDDEISTQVWALLSTLYPPQDLLERRADTRYPFPHLIRLTPTDEDGTPTGDSIVVVGKHLSAQGLGFYHAKPLPHRRMVAAIELGRGRWTAFVIDLNWCRFTRGGWYESGGRFLQAAAPPAET